MAFESLAFDHEFVITDFPPQWLPLTYLYDPDLPLFPIQYFHILDPALERGRLPAERDRLYGFIQHVKLDGANLSVSIIINKDVSTGRFSHYKPALEAEVSARLGMQNPVTTSDMTGVLTGPLAASNPLVSALWNQVVEKSFGATLPFGGMWDAVKGLVRFVASWNSDGGRKGELIETHCFLSEFGEKIQTKTGVHADFYLLPTFSELTHPANTLSNFPKFALLVEAATEFVTKYCDRVAIGPHSFSAFRMSKVGSAKQLKTEVVLNIIEQAKRSHRKALFENFTAFGRGPHRSIIFLLMLHDLRHGLWNPSAITSSDCGLLYAGLSRTYQSPKVITLYAQQCFGNESVLPLDNWVKTFLRWPLNFRPSKPATFHAELFSHSAKWGKLERLIWIAAQARKVHSSVCKEILWCVRYGDPDQLMRGANPFACKICSRSIRTVCPSYADIKDELVAFNPPRVKAKKPPRLKKGGKSESVKRPSTAVPAGVFVIETSLRDNKSIDQTFMSCAAPVARTSDTYSPRDRPEQFKAYPQRGHDGEPLSVEAFIDRY